MRSLAATGELLDVEMGHELLRQGSAPNRICFVLSGLVEVTCHLVGGGLTANLTGRTNHLAAGAILGVEAVGGGHGRVQASRERVQCGASERESVRDHADPQKNRRAAGAEAQRQLPFHLHRLFGGDAHQFQRPGLRTVPPFPPSPAPLYTHHNLPCYISTAHARARTRLLCTARPYST
jgi:hypothetical protein